MNGLTKLSQLLGKSKQETDTVKTLYLVMEKVGGYEQLLNLPISALLEIIKCMDYFAKQEQKSMKSKR